MTASIGHQIPANPGNTFSERLRFAQASKGVTNEDLAGRVGVTMRLLGKWRAGDVQPNGSNLARLCAELDRPAEWFFETAAKSEETAA